MRITKILSATLLTLLLASSHSFARGGGGQMSPRFIDRVAEEIGLDDETVTKIKGIIFEGRRAAVDLKAKIEQAKLDISNLQVALQRASEDRKAENLDFQKTVAEQMVTAEVLHKALDRLATYYDSAAFAQMKAAKKQTPPVPQMESK